MKKIAHALFLASVCIACTSQDEAVDSSTTPFVKKLETALITPATPASPKSIQVINKPHKETSHSEHGLCVMKQLMIDANRKN